MTIGVVVIAAGRSEHLGRVLHGLADQCRPADRVVLVEMGDAVELVAPPALAVERITVAAPGGSLPLGAARNAGMSALGCDRGVFLDVDCIPHPQLVAEYDVALATHRGVLACGRVRYLRRGWSVSAPGDLDAWSDPHPARPTPPVDLVDEHRHELFWSLNFAVDAATWSRLGGFDPVFCGYGAEDTDLGLRARAIGVPLLWVAGALAYHQWHPPTRHDPGRTAEIVANARRFRDRWGRWPMLGWLEELAAAGAVVFDPSADVLETRP